MRRCASSPRRARPPSPACSAGSRSATTARRAWWRPWRRRASSGPLQPNGGAGDFWRPAAGGMSIAMHEPIAAVPDCGHPLRFGGLRSVRPRPRRLARERGREVFDRPFELVGRLQANHRGRPGARCCAAPPASSIWQRPGKFRWDYSRAVRAIDPGGRQADLVLRQGSGAGQRARHGRDARQHAGDAAVGHAAR